MSPDYAKEWRLKADADELAARRALQDSKRHPSQAEIACFHAQHAVEIRYPGAMAAVNDAALAVAAMRRLAALCRKIPG